MYSENMHSSKEVHCCIWEVLFTFFFKQIFSLFNFKLIFFFKNKFYNKY